MPDLLSKLMNYCSLGHYGKSERRLEAFQGRGTVLLSALYGYDAMSPDATPRELFRFLKKNVQIQKKNINQYSGRISRYAGDAFLAFWTERDVKSSTASAAFTASRAILEEFANIMCTYPRFNFQLTISLASGPLTGKFCGPLKEYELSGPPVALTDKLHGFRSSHRPRVILEENTVSFLEGNTANLIEIGQLTDNKNKDLKVYYWTIL